MIILINWKEIALSNILNLDKILCIFFGENIFMNLNNKSDEFPISNAGGYGLDLI